MAEVEYPRWVYPPDGGPGCVVQTPDEKPKGWLDAPSEPGPALGERIIGQPIFPHPEQPIAYPPTVMPHSPAIEDDDEPSRKSKRK